MTEFKQAIEIKNLSYSIAGQLVLDDINMKVGKGEYVGLLGPNGGGKTTLIKMILGILTPKAGEIFLFDNLFKNPREKIGYVPQRVSSGGLDFPATVYEVVGSGLARNTHSAQNIDLKIKKAMEVAQISDLASRHMSELSGGQRQKVFIARSLVDEPYILILDEPTVAIDIQSQSNFYAFLRDLNLNHSITILLISHDISAIAQEVSKVYFLNRNLECFHSSGEFLDQENLDRLYGKNINLISHHH